MDSRPARCPGRRGVRVWPRRECIPADSAAEGEKSAAERQGRSPLPRALDTRDVRAVPCIRAETPPGDDRDRPRYRALRVRLSIRPDLPDPGGSSTTAPAARDAGLPG